MRRKNTTTGSKFTVRGQVYIQTGAFFHPMSNDREVRVLELDTTCPECSQTFQTTASMRQISTRQLVRRCPECRKIHSGPVPIVTRAAHKTRKKPPGRKVRKLSRRPAPYRSVLGVSDEPGAPAPNSEQPQRRLEALCALDWRRHHVKSRCVCALDRTESPVRD